MAPLFNTLSGRSSFGRSGGNPALFLFTTHTFTNAGAVGRYGPTLSALQNQYAAQTWSSNSSFFTQGRAQGYQVFTVPKTGIYLIEAAGAAGQTGANSGNHSYGARIRAAVSLTMGDKLEMVVGQRGGTTGNQSTGSAASGGGGGTFVVLNGTTTPILIAGGGAGTYSSFHSSTFWNGQTRRQPRWDGYNFSPNSVGSQPAIGYGGSGYHAGGAGGLLGGGIGYSGRSISDASTNGDGTSQLYTHGASFSGSNDFGTFYAIGGNWASYSDVVGGFGGGGGGHGGNNTGGGGGGYSGGHGGQTSLGGSYLTGIGGGSFIISSATSVATSDGQFDGATSFNGSSITNLSSYNDGHGYVTITAL